jgi:hypothetical protein
MIRMLHYGAILGGIAAVLGALATVIRTLRGW